MASYSDGVYATSSKNLNAGQFDETNALTVLKEFVKTLEYAKQFSPDRISDNFKSKMYSVNASVETIIQYWQLNSSRKKAPPKVDGKVWGNEISLRYLFEDYIEYKERTMNDVKVQDLFCRICEMAFPNSSDYLHDHLKGVGHLICYEKIKKDDEALCDTLWDDPLQKCKYLNYIKHSPNNLELFCKICCVTVPKFKKNLKEHIDGKNHIKQFEDMINFTTGSKRINDEKVMKDKVGAFVNSTENVNINEAFFADSNLNNLSSGVKGKLNINKPNTKTVPVVNKLNFEQLKESVTSALTSLTMKLLQEDHVLHELVFLCCLCRYHTIERSAWNDHCTSSKHKEMLSEMSGSGQEYRLLNCVCDLMMICDERTFNWHLESADHHRMKNLMQRLKERAGDRNINAVPNSNITGAGAVRKNSSNIGNNLPMYKSLNDLEASSSSEDENTSVDNYGGNNSSDSSDDDSVLVDDFDGSSETSNFESGFASRPASNVSGVTPDKQKKKKKQRQKKKDKSAVKDKNAKKDQSITKLGLKDLAEGTTKDEVFRAIQHLGLIKHINVIGNIANVFIKLKDEFMNIVDLQLTVPIKGAHIIIGKPVYIEEFTTPETIRVQFSSAERVLNLMENLVRVANRADNLSILGQVESKRNIIERDVRNALRVAQTTLGNEVQNVFTIGSRALGLVLDNAVYDLFVELGDNYFGNKSQDLLLLSARAAHIDSALNSDKMVFSDVTVVGDENPIVHFKHQLTGARCQIYCHNGLVVEKTNLIKAYLDSDDRVKQVVLVIKEWARQTGLTEVISQYAVTWLVLFSLMQGSDPLLSPVIVLRNKNEEGRKFIAGFNCDIDRSLLPKMPCKKKPIELILAFFNFYKKSKLHTGCLPLTGRVASADVVNNFGLVMTNGLILQDPIELNCNLTEKLKDMALVRFKRTCKLTKLCLEAK